MNDDSTFLNLFHLLAALGLLAVTLALLATGVIP